MKKKSKPKMLWVRASVVRLKNGGYMLEIERTKSTTLGVVPSKHGLLIQIRPARPKP